MGVPINNVTRRVVYAASGTGPYAFTFEILAATDIAVYRDDTLLTLTTNYTVTINPNGTGSVTLTAAPTGATQIAIVGNRTISRTTDFVTGGDFFANTLNDELDQQTIFAQQNAEGLQRALQAPQTDPTSINMTLPGRTARANKTLTFDANGNPAAGVSAADVANAVTYASNAAASATAAAASASAASSSASSASGSASTATTQASNASTSATNAANSASAASTSATNAASSASTAATQASNASTSATNAASSASAASTSASNAATSATNASNSASSASTSATNAANSATAAASSASSAAASAASAATALDSFDDRYLGTKASDPTLDNDGNALVSGALYFSTSQNIMKVYDGASWIAATSAGNTSLLRFRYIATAGQTSFSGADSNSATLTYTVNNIVVFLNGVALDQTEYTATNGTSVVLTAGAVLNDELVIVAFKSFVTADMVPASTGGTYSGNLTYAPGTANQVLYLNGSKVISGSANMTFNGTTLTVNDLTDSSLTANRLVFAGTSGNLQTSSNYQTDASGNLGLGVTPSAWVGNNSIQAGSFGAFSGGSTFGVALSSNAYSTSAGWAARYIGNTFATLYAQQQTNGQHAWYIAPSGTAGNVITWTQAMTLDASGNLGIGTTSPATRLHVLGTSSEVARFIRDNTAAASGGITIGNNSRVFTIYGDSNALSFWDTTAAAERARITSAGNVGISNTNPPALLSVGNASPGTSEATNVGAIQIQGSGGSATGGGGLEFKAAATGNGYGFQILCPDLGSTNVPLVFCSRNNSAAWTERMRLSSGGELLVGSPTDQGAYNIQCNGTGVWGAAAYVNGSDERIKEDIAPITSGLDVVAQMNPVTYRYKESWSKDRSVQTGFIAQELLVAMEGKNYVDGVVQQGGSEGYYSVAYQNIIPLLTKAIQEQQAMIDELKAKVAALENA